VLKSGPQIDIVEKETIIEESFKGHSQLFTLGLIKITIFTNVLFLAINYFQRAFPLILNIGTFCFAIGLLLMYHSRFSKYVNAVLFYFYIVWISFYVSICGLETYMLIYFVVLMALSVLLFENDKTRVKMASLSVAVLILILAFKPHIPLLMEYDNPYRAYVHIFITLFVVFYSIRKYANVAELESGKKDKLVNEVNEKNIELERFAYITSHDLKQPIRNISSFAGLLERSVNSKNDKEKNLDYIDFIKKSSSNMESLVNDILSLSKIGSQKFDDGEIDLNTIIELSKDSLRILIQEKSAIINIEKLPTILGNELYLKLLFQNLIENALKYNTSSIPKVEITTDENEIHHNIYVKDNGLGIDQKYYNIVFQPFKRLHSNKEYQGSGLGLSICKKIVERHQGIIQLNSNEDVGSLFTLSFPKIIN